VFSSEKERQKSEEWATWLLGKDKGRNIMNERMKGRDEGKSYVVKRK